MTSENIEAAFKKAQELALSASVALPMQAVSPTLLETIFIQLVNCDDDMELAKKFKEAAA